MIAQLHPGDEPRWIEFLCGHRDALPFHHPAWLRALHAAYGYETIALADRDESGNINGVLPLALKRGLTGKRLVSLPHTPIAGPIASHDQAAAQLAAAAVECARAHKARLELKTRDDTLATSSVQLARDVRSTTYVLALPGDPTSLRFGSSRNHGRIKWAVRKAAREGVTLRDGDSEHDLRAWHRLYLSTMRTHAVPPRPYTFFEALWAHLRPAGLLRLMLAEGRGQMLAGSIFLTFGTTAFYAFNGRRQEELGLRPNDLIQWHAIHDAAAAGCCRYDFGEVEDHQHGLAEFKGKWGARPSELFVYRFPQARVSPTHLQERSRIRRCAEAAWRRLPVGATSWIGDLAYRRL